jgi:crotonobetainyl-CoA:carnitine CoA-transferase CaiB-like acyl-CoA transferase
MGAPGFTRVLSPRRKPYRTADGYACILPYSDRNWRDFFDFVGRPDLKEDERFKVLAVRVQHIDELYALLEDEAPKRTTAEWVGFCDRVSIPSMPVLSLDALPDDEHLRAVGLFASDEHPTEGAYRTIRHPVSFSGAPFRIRRHAPSLGQHTEELLTELGLPSPGEERPI